MKQGPTGRWARQRRRLLLALPTRRVVEQGLALQQRAQQLRRASRTQHRRNCGYECMGHSGRAHCRHRQPPHRGTILLYDCTAVRHAPATASVEASMALNSATSCQPQPYRRPSPMPYSMMGTARKVPVHTSTNANTSDRTRTCSAVRWEDTGKIAAPGARCRSRGSLATCGRHDHCDLDICRSPGRRAAMQRQDARCRCSCLLASFRGYLHSDAPCPHLLEHKVV